MSRKTTDGRLDEPCYLLAIDASSTAIGWAVFAPIGRLTDCGLIKASSADLGRRMDRLTDALDLLVLPAPIRAAMEWNAGRPAVVNARVKRSAKVTATLCHAQGAVYAALRRRGLDVDRIDEGGKDGWTGNVRKDKRAVKIRASYPEIAAQLAGDEGMDICDAIGIGIFVINRHRMKVIEAAGKVLRMNLKGLAS